MREPQKGAASEHLWRYRLAVLLLPLLVLWHSDDALYSPPFYGDAWFYLGYFHNLLEFKRQLFYGFYYGSRLSWILPGFLVHWIFPPLVANAVLHLAVQSTATLSLFSILRLTSGIRAAFLGTMVFAVYPWLWVATGWDYVDGAGIAYCLLTIALLTHSARSPVRRWYLVLAGAALAGMAYTHLFLASFGPLPLLYYFALLWLWHGKPPLRQVLLSCVWMTAGFVIVTLVFCGINYWLDGNFWFYTPSLKQGRAMAQNFIYTQSIWYRGELAPWLWPGVAGCATAIVMLATQMRKPVSRAHAFLVFSGLLLLAVSYMCLLQARGSTVLGHYPYASYLLPFIFLVMSSYFSPAAETMTARAYLLTCGAAAVALGALWYGSGRYLAGISPLAMRALLGGSAVALVLAFLLRHRVTGPPVAAAGLIAFSAVCLANTVRFNGNDLHGNRGVYQRILHARARVETLRHRRPLRYWYDHSEANFYDYFGLDSTYLAEFSRLGTDFPRDCSEAIPPDALVVVTSQKEHAEELARTALTACWQPSGVHPVMEGFETVDGTAGPFTLATYRVELGAATPGIREKVLKTLDLDRVSRGDPKASIDRWPEGILVTSIPGRGAFAARISLGLDPGIASQVAVYIHARVLDGQVGMGVLDAAGKTFLVHRAMWPMRVATDVVLRVPQLPGGDLVIDNQSDGVSSVIVEKIEIRQAQ